ncbi:MAG: LexA family protein [Betaproteobacteria bacterium]|jgi:DNA polymerase V|nr:translesion error-prone DNA polymerase V autoproteolytic subunit [Betaproteobacteria bacterium]
MKPDAPIPVASVPRPLPPLCAGRVAAGFPSPATDHLDRRLDLNEHLLLHPQATFFMRVKGDSMIGAGIHDGDLLIVDRSLEATSGRVVVAALDGELTVKRLRRRRGRVVLQPENPAYPEIPVSEEHSLDIWGVVAYVVHAP